MPWDNALSAKHPSGLYILTDIHRMKEEDANDRTLYRESGKPHGHTMFVHSIALPSILILLNLNSATL